MLRVAIKGVMARKLRALLTGLAIVLGVAMISGTYVLTDTIGKAFDGIFERSYAGTDAVVTARPVVADTSARTPTIAAAEVTRIRALPEVAAASGQVADEGIQVTDRSGKPIDTKGAPALALGVDPDSGRFSPAQVVAGRLPRGDGEIALDRRTATDHGYGLGDRVAVVSDGSTRSFRLSGLVAFGGASSLGSATVAVVDVPTAQALLGRGGRFDQIMVAAAPGVDRAELVRAVARDLPSALQVRDGAAEAKAESAEVGEGLSFINRFLLTFAGIALFVGAFVIANTMAITTAQRTRELATLRTLGASRRQVRRSVTVEALVLGLLSSVLGVVAGVGVAKGLNALFVALDIDLPQTGLVVQTRTVVIGLLVGTVVTVLASLMPARRASGVSPIAAVREGAELPRSALARHRPLVGCLLGVVGAAGLVVSLFADLAARPRLLLMALGLLVTFIAVAVVMPIAIRPLVSIIGRPVGWMGGEPARIGRENAARNPVRTAASAAALMIGIALIVFVAVLGSGLRDSGRVAVEKQLVGTHVISKTTGFSTVPAGTAGAVATVDGVQSATGLRTGIAVVSGEDATISGVAPEAFADLYRFEWAEGSDATLRALAPGDALVARDVARDRGLSVGEALTLRSESGVEQRVTVRGVYRPSRFDSLVGEVVITHADFDAAFTRPEDAIVLLRASASTDAIARSLPAGVDADVQPTGVFVTERAKSVDQLLNLLYVLLALSVLVSMLGLVNTLALSVIERTREIGLLRAVGMSRRQTRRMIVRESVMTALIGVGVGLPVGIGLAALATGALREYDVTFSVPVGTLITLCALAAVLGVVAAVLPARRAARLDVLKALQYE